MTRAKPEAKSNSVYADRAGGDAKPRTAVITTAKANVPQMHAEISLRSPGFIGRQCLKKMRQPSPNGAQYSKNKPHEEEGYRTLVSRPKANRPKMARSAPR